MPEDSNDVRKQIRGLRLPEYIRWDQGDVSTGSTARTSWIAKGHLYESAILSVEHTLTYVGAQSDKVKYNVLDIQTSLQISIARRKKEGRSDQQVTQDPATHAIPEDGVPILVKSEPLDTTFPPIINFGCERYNVKTMLQEYLRYHLTHGTKPAAA